MSGDPTLDPARRSWVGSAAAHPTFPIQNLPLGVFSPPNGGPRGGIAIGDHILDVQGCLNAGLLTGTAARAAEAAAGRTLNALLALAPAARIALRRRVADLLDVDADRDEARQVAALLHLADDCEVHLPAAIGDYTDFYAGIHHATNVGRLFRPEAPLLPNYKHIPIAYHGRASTVRVSDVPVRRPRGQRKPAGADAPEFGPCRNLDFELELGVWIGPGASEPIPLAAAPDHVAGLCVLNDWSARDIQSWEYQPLGPFLAKNFATTISPWIVTREALAPFRIPPRPRPDGDPSLLPYLVDPDDAAHGGYAIDFEALLLTERMRDRKLPPHPLSRTEASHLYWTVGQMVAHHTSGGCELRPGDLFGSGTISAPDPSGYGSLLELSQGGRAPIDLASGESRTFLEDGDEVILRGTCRADGFVSIGFGDCRAKILPA